jgi:hypothetical protein
MGRRYTALCQILARYAQLCTVSYATGDVRENAGTRDVRHGGGASTSVVSLEGCTAPLILFKRLRDLSPRFPAETQYIPAWDPACQLSSSTE